MRVGFDAKRAFRNGTGLGNYSRCLIESLIDRHPEGEYLLFSPRKPSGRFPEFEARAQAGAFVVTPPLLAGRLFGSVWRSFCIPGLLRRERVDVYQGLSHEIPLGIKKGSCRVLVNIHDLIFLKYPGYYHAWDRAVYAAKVAHACRNSDVVVALSAHTRRDLLEQYRLPENKVRVVYPSVNPVFAAPVGAERKNAVRKQYGLPDRFVLSVGTMSARKNLLTLVRALECPGADRGLALVAVGGGGTYRRTVEAYVRERGLGGRVRMLGAVSQADLPALYALAEVFACPSFYEGFGLPILEALTAGVPVVASAGGCFPEAGGPGSLYANPSKPEEWADRLSQAAGNSGLRERMIEEGLRHAAAFSSKTFADSTWALYR